MGWTCGRGYEALATSSRSGRHTGDAFTLAAGVLVIALVSLVDFTTAAYLSFSPFYLLPVAVVTWRSGVPAGAAAAAAVVLVPLVADLGRAEEMADASQMGPVAPWWNALMRGTASGLVIALVATQRRSLRRESVLARTDMLTGVANRRHFLDAVTAELQRCQRYSRPFTLVLLDVDRFKQVNDEFGHATGDAVLRAVSVRLTDRLRAVDLVARLGGDEFALLLRETDAQQADRIVDALRTPLTITVPSEKDAGLSLQVGLSVGTATVTGHAGQHSAEEVLADADRAMYGSKRNKATPPPESAQPGELR